jgi:hypothetical protein
VRTLLKKCRKLLKHQKDEIDKLINKIDSLEQDLEYNHEKILEIFEAMDKFSNEFLIRKDSIDFLSPYIAKVEAPAQQIPIMHPNAAPQILNLETLEKRIIEFEKVILNPALNFSGILETS